MRKSPFAVRAAFFMVFAVGLGLFVGWLTSRQGDVKPVPAPAVTDTLASAPAPAPAPEAAPPTSEATPPPTVDNTTDASAASDDSTNWEQKLEGILLSSDDENGKANQLLALIPTAPPDAQVELAQHLVNLVQDDNYSGAEQMLTNSATPSAVSTVLMNDLLNRNNNLKLPMLLEVAENDNHPLKDQAREMLELLIQEDNGTNWSQWATSINNWLAQNSQ